MRQPVRGVFGLLGSGEFDPWAEEVDRWLLDQATSGSRRVLIAPTASAPEGDEVFNKWGSKGLEHYRRLGFEAQVLPLKTRDDAMRQDIADELGDAGLVFFSGGNPRYLADTLRDTTFWRELMEAMARGTAYGGCSGGVQHLGDHALDSQHASMDDSVYGPGLGLFPGVEFAVHWDALDRYVPGLQSFIRSEIAAGAVHAFIDENTAMAGDGHEWTVMGKGAVTVGRDEAERAYHAGESFTWDDAGR
ncbi:MAG: Type 1 glutamine amidotransferase-like domain-containing protein [Actinobacteria bacterium]|nr:Type 1 glutamine amidotransferase-like domain-containing protein [Actinomycetota bacterium]